MGARDLARRVGRAGAAVGLALVAVTASRADEEPPPCAPEEGNPVATARWRREEQRDGVAIGLPPGCAFVEAAHSHPEVTKMGEEYGRVSGYVPIGQVPEAAPMLSEFTPLHLER